MRRTTEEPAPDESDHSSYPAGVDFPVYADGASPHRFGEEAAEALLAQFPSRDLDEPVTKEFVAVEIAGVRREMAGFRGEVHAEFAKVRTEMAAQTDRLMARMQISVGMGFGFVAILTVLAR